MDSINICICKCVSFRDIPHPVLLWVVSKDWYLYWKMHFVYESILWGGYPNQRMLFVKTTPNKCGRIIYWLVGDRVGAASTVKTTWKVRVINHSYSTEVSHTEYTHAPTLVSQAVEDAFGKAGGVCGGVMGSTLGWPAEWTTVRNMTKLSTISIYFILCFFRSIY